MTLTTADGARLAATFYPVAADVPPGLVLVHMLGSSRAGWEPFAARAQQLGYACIAFDMRGHGQSAAPQGAAQSYRNFTYDDWLGVLNDIDAAKQALLDKGAGPENIAIVGASIGANLALLYAARHPDIPAVVMVSPGLDYKGLRTEEAVAEYGKRPLLLMSSEGDSYSASSCTTLKRAAPGLCELREYPGAAHGTSLLDASTNALEQIFLWLKPIIGPKYSIS